MIYFSGVVITALLCIAYLYTKIKCEETIYLKDIFLGIGLSTLSWIPVVAVLIVVLMYLITEYGSIVIWKKK